jgi:hypothetical protein
MSRLVLGLALAGCSGTTLPDDSGVPPRGEPDVLVVGTANDYSVGGLFGVHSTTGQVTEVLAATSGDPAVRWVDGRVVVMNRFNTDTLLAYELGVWDAPVLEFALADGANPYDVSACGDGSWLIAAYGLSALQRVDAATGALLGEVDLSAHAGEGPPEAAMFAWLDGRRLLTLHRFNDDWSTDVGQILEVSCDAVLEAWPTGPVPDLAAHDGDQLLLRTGAYFTADGGVDLWDPAGGSVPLVAETDLAGDVMGVASDGGEGLLVAVAVSDGHELRCGTSDNLAEVSNTPHNVTFIQRGPDGLVWVGLHPLPSSSEAGSIERWDVSTCERVDVLDTPIPPYDVDFVAEDAG